MILNWGKFLKVIEKFIPWNIWIELPLKYHPWEFLSCSGIYVFFNQNEVVYIGNSTNLANRLKSHLEKKNNKIIFRNQEIISKIKIKRLVYYHAAYLEGLLILKFRPKHNSRILLKNSLEGSFEFGKRNNIQ